MTINPSLVQAIEQFGKSIVEKNAHVTCNFLYPKLFEFVPKKTIEASLKAAYESADLKIILSDYKLNDVLFDIHLDQTEYSLITTSYKQEIQYAEFPENDTEKQEILNFYYEMLAERYGNENVSFNPSKREIKANSISQQLAIKSKDSWYFLENKENLLPLYSKFLPENIIKKLEEQFPTIEHDDEEEIEADFEMPTKINSITPIKKGAETKAQYLLGWEVFLNGDEDCENFLRSQSTNLETFEYADMGLELIYENNKLTTVYQYDSGEKSEKKLTQKELGLPYKEYEENQILKFSENNKGLHVLGGEIPKEFKMPTQNCVVSFQYLGSINPKDKYFKWLPFQLHLICPIYLNFQFLYLDYSDPNHPIILNNEEIESADTSFDEEMNRNTEIVYKTTNYSLKVEYDFFGTGHAGIPSWLQGPTYPKCPKNGKTMRFVCQLNGGPETARTNIEIVNQGYESYFEEMNFWGDGILYVFFEPESKTACYFIQNT